MKKWNICGIKVEFMKKWNICGIKVEFMKKWNICGIKVEFMKKWKISVLGIADCHPKGNGTRQMQDNYVTTRSGVSTRERAINGVAFVMQPDIAKKRYWKQILSQKE